MGNFICASGKIFTPLAGILRHLLETYEMVNASIKSVNSRMKVMTTLAVSKKKLVVVGFWNLAIVLLG